LQYGFSPEKLHHSDSKESAISKQYCSIFGEKVRPLESSPIRKAITIGVRCIDFKIVILKQLIRNIKKKKLLLILNLYKFQNNNQK